MIHICVLLCALIAPFTHTIEIQHEFPTHKIPELLSTTQKKVPDYEVITVEHKIHKRSIKELSIKAKIDGTEKEFILQCVKGFLAGKDTKVWIAEKNGNKFNYTLQNGIMEEVNITFYHDNKTQSTISHVVNKRGISEFSGIIDSDKVIRPFKNYVRKRRDATSELFYKSENDNAQNYHVIYKRSIPPINEDINNNYNKMNKSHQAIQKSNLEKPDIVYPEILVYVDTTLFKYFDSDIVQTVAYTLTLWNGADLNFRQMKNPEIRLNIAGIVLCQDQIVPQNPFVVRTETWNTFGQFMYNEEQFKFQKDYDIAVLLGADPEFEEDVVGQAFTTGVCSSNTLFEVIESTAVILDDTYLSGLDTATHELAHLFGVPHDGLKGHSKLNGLGAEACPFSDGFIMSYERYNAKQFYFSECSKEIMSFFLSQESAKCLRNNPGVNRTDDQILRILPGKYMSLDEQCQNRGYLRAVDIVNQNICTNITCLFSNNYDNTVYVAALEGSPCDLGKFCIRGECVKVKFDEADENLSPKILFPPFYQPPGFNKSAVEQCKEIGITALAESYFNGCRCHCQYMDPDLEGIMTYFTDAQDGTLCNNNNGYCRGKKCVDDPDGFIVRKTTSTISKSITNFDYVTIVNNINDYESTTAFNSETTPYKTTTIDKSAPDFNTIAVNTFPNMPDKSKSDNVHDPVIGLVVRKTTSTTSESITNSDHVNTDNNINNYETTTAFNSKTHDHCQGDECVKGIVKMSPDNYDQYDKENILMPNGETLLALEAKIMLADKECKNNGAICALEIADCVLCCMKFATDFKGIERYSIHAPNDFPCGKNGTCSNGICTQF